MGVSQSKKPQTPRRENASDLAATLRMDEDFLAFVKWATEHQHHVTIDDNCWLRHSCVTPGFTSSGILSVDDRTCWDTFKSEYLKKQSKMRGMIEEATEHARGGLIKINS